MKILNLSGGQVCLVDDADYDYLLQFTWNEIPRHDGLTSYAYRYIRTTSGGYIKRKMHQELMRPPQGFSVDHVDGNGLNNQRSNLRLATQREQSRNQHIRKPRKYSPYKGVGYNRVHGRDTLSKPWRARIRIDGKLLCIGWFATAREAAIAYDKSALEHFGEFAAINNVEGTKQ